MRKISFLMLAGSLIGLGFYLAGCGAASGGGGTAAGGTVKTVVSAVNYGTARYGHRALTSNNTNNGAPNGAQSMGILSGPPLGMKVYLQSIALTQSGGSNVSIYSSATSNTTASGVSVTGCQLELTSGNIDLSVCPGLGTLTVPTGTYTGMMVIFAEAAEIQGCLNGQFSSVTQSSPYTNMLGTSSPATFYYPSPFPSTFFPIVTDGVLPNQTYTYCTRSDQFYYQAETASTTVIGNDASYQVAPAGGTYPAVTSPTYTTIDLGSGNGQAKTMAQLEAGSIALTSSTVPAAAGGTTFTLAVDMNRMLEFFANVRNDFNPPNPSMHTGTSYFFTTKFAPTGGPSATSAVTAYAGALGSVQGYQWTAMTTGGSPTVAAAGWYTLFLDASGNYLGGSMYEDDDNELTILKGNASITSGTMAGGATLTMDIAGVCTGFTTSASVSGTGTCALTESGSSSTYTVSFTRLL